MKRLSLFLILCSTTLFSQVVEIFEGDFTNLKGISTYNLIFDYSNLKVSHYNTEEDFLRSKAEGVNGEKFKKDWFSDREKYYEPEFIERFNYYLKKSGIKVGKNLDNVDYANIESVDYVMKIQTVSLYTGYSNVDFRSNSEITVDISIYNINDPENLLLKGRYYNVNVETSKSANQATKISKSYGQLGKLIAVDIRKSLK